MGEEGEGAGEPAGDPPAGPPARREEQIRNALAFLTHPKVRAAPRRRRRRGPLPPPPSSPSPRGAREAFRAAAEGAGGLREGRGGVRGLPSASARPRVPGSYTLTHSPDPPFSSAPRPAPALPLRFAQNPCNDIYGTVCVTGGGVFGELEVRIPGEERPDEGRDRRGLPPRAPNPKLPACGGAGTAAHTGTLPTSRGEGATTEAVGGAAWGGAPGAAAEARTPAISGRTAPGRRGGGGLLLPQLPRAPG